MAPPKAAELPARVLRLTVTALESLIKRAPPLEAELPDTVQALTVSVAKDWLKIAPPAPPTREAELPMRAESLTVAEPKLRRAPPLTAALQDSALLLTKSVPWLAM